MTNHQSATSVAVPGVAFHPWVGTEYASSGLDGKKILILGESFYGPLDPVDAANLPSFAEVVVRGYITRPAGLRLFRTVEKLFGRTPGADAAERLAFWNRVAFGNFIQDVLVDRTSEHRPTEQQWSAARPCFLDLLDALRPDAVLVLGEGVWMSLSTPHFLNSKPVASAMKSDGSEPFLYEWTMPAGYKVRATWVNHPTGSFGFRLDKWAPRVQTLLEAASERSGE